MNNKKILIQAESYTDFSLAMSLVMDGKQRVVGWSVIEHELVLHWTKSPTSSYTKLPYGMDCNEATKFAWGWVENTGPHMHPPYEKEENRKGFCLFHDDCERARGDLSTLVTIRTIWVDKDNL